MVRCIESIIKQDYKFVEVIISDDSPDENIKETIHPYTKVLNIKYFHNNPSLGSPKNWNAALAKANGYLLILLHQDDWFNASNSLTSYVKAFKQTDADFVFCQNTAIDENGNAIILQSLPTLLNELSEKPNHLLLSQVIGPPSNTMLKKTIEIRYDERFIWLVDVDYYSRILKHGYKYKYLEKHLVSIGLHEDQTTAFCRANSDIIFKENIWFAAKLEKKDYNDVLLYDYYWRLLRNYKIRSIKDVIANNVNEEEIPFIIKHMLSFQKNISLRLLQIGFVSKLLMALNYLRWKLNLK